MRLLQLLRQKVFFKTRDFGVVDDPLRMNVHAVKQYFGLVTTVIVGLTFIEEFAYPTPDILHDIRMLISKDYLMYAESRGLKFSDPKLDNTIRHLHWIQGQIAAQQNYDKNDDIITHAES